MHPESLVSMWPRLRRLPGPHARRAWEAQLLAAAAVSLDGLPAYHVRVLLDGLPVFERPGLLLAGGYASSAHEILHRPSQDLNFVTRDGAPLPEIAGQVMEGFRAAGYGVRLVEATGRYARGRPHPGHGAALGRPAGRRAAALRDRGLPARRLPGVHEPDGSWSPPASRALDMGALIGCLVLGSALPHRPPTRQVASCQHPAPPRPAAPGRHRHERHAPQRPRRRVLAHAPPTHQQHRPPCHAPPHAPCSPDAKLISMRPGRGRFFGTGAGGSVSGIGRWMWRGECSD